MLGNVSLAEILSFYSKSAAGRRQQAGGATSAAVVVFGTPATTVDCRILDCSGGAATLRLELSAHAGGAVLIDLGRGLAHYGRIAPGAAGESLFSIVESHDLEGPGAPSQLRRIWLDRTLTEGADSANMRAAG